MTDLKKCHVHISGDAKQMLDAHATFLAQVNEEAADRFVDSFAGAVDSLKSLPERCAWYKGNYVPQYLYRQLLFGERYALIFQVEETAVYIEYVIDFRQDYSWLFR